MTAAWRERLGTAVIVATLVVGTAGAAGCSGSSTTTTAAPTGTGATPGSPSGSPSGSTPGSTPGSTAPAGCVDRLEVTNAAAADVPGLTDGPIDVETAWADKGPHPANTVDQDAELELALATFPIPKDPQFGYSIPVGVPEVPAGELIVIADLGAAAAPVAPGQTFVESTAKDAATADGKIRSLAAWFGSTRLLPGDVEITITAISDERICGTIGTATGTSTQQFVGIEGTFVADRVQHLEAAGE